MNETVIYTWNRFKKWYRHYPEIGLSLDISRMTFNEAQLQGLEFAMARALGEMKELEQGAIANQDERRMVGHYWLRDPSLAPTSNIAQAISQTVTRIKTFARSVISGSIHGSGGAFINVIVVGIGGSALGPQLVAKALTKPDKSTIKIHFLDNTDPDGIDSLTCELADSLSKTLVLVISKSGSTKETCNGMLELMDCYEKRGFSFERHAVAITAENSHLDRIAVRDNWLERFPMWEWIGGRTSELSAVGLVPAALQGVDIDKMLDGARRCDEITRNPIFFNNPAALLAAMWFLAGDGTGCKDMVVIPYKDRLDLLPRYLQQLIMESLGKRTDRDGNIVYQGLTVYGNKGSTDQHALVQQLRDGLNNFFVTFIEVLSERDGGSILVEDEFTSGDFLSGFLWGTRQALSEQWRESITITLNTVSAFSIGVLIALFERSVGLYASMINVNAYNQPGVEAGKQAATQALILQRKTLTFLRANRGRFFSVEEIGAAVNETIHLDLVFNICMKACINQRFRIKCLPDNIAVLSRFASE